MIWKTSDLPGKSLWTEGHRFIHNGDSRALDSSCAVVRYSPHFNPPKRPEIPIRTNGTPEGRQIEHRTMFTELSTGVDGSVDKWSQEE